MKYFDAWAELGTWLRELMEADDQATIRVDDVLEKLDLLEMEHE